MKFEYYKQFKQYIKQYIKVFGLYDCDIFVGFEALGKYKIAEIRSAKSKYNYSYEIILNKNYVDPCIDIKIKNTAIHELMHIIVDDYISDKKKNKDAEERFVNRLANIIEHINIKED